MRAAACLRFSTRMMSGWLPHKLAEQTDIMRHHESVGIVSGTVIYWQSWAGDAIN
jgi:hypothetical protein